MHSVVALPLDVERKDDKCHRLAERVKTTVEGVTLLMDFSQCLRRNNRCPKMKMSRFLAVKSEQYILTIVVVKVRPL